MRIRVAHETSYTYERPARAITQILRLTPGSHEGQQVGSWRIDTNADVRLRQGEDAFGNILDTLSVEGPISSLTLTVTGEVTTFDTGGVVRGPPEKLPAEVYLRDTPLTQADEGLASFVRRVTEEQTDPLAQLHRLLSSIHTEVAFDTSATDVGTSAAQAFALRRGVCQDLTHVFIAAARLLGRPARYVSGHLVRTDKVEQEATHAWAEALVPGLGWVGFDPTNGISPDESYIRIAIGLDYLGAAPVRGARQGGGGEQMSVRLAVQQLQSSQQ